MPDDLDERENEPPEGLKEADRDLLIFSLQQSYMRLRRDEQECHERIPLSKANVESCTADGHMEDAARHLDEAINLAKRLGQTEWAIDRFEELNYRFPFIQGAEFFAEADT